MLTTLKIIGLILVSMIVGYLFLALFFGGSTGHYHVDVEATERNYTRASIIHLYQDMRFRPDRCIFVGPPALVWQLYFNLTQPAEPLYRTADLIIEEKLIWP